MIFKIKRVQEGNAIWYFPDRDIASGEYYSVEIGATRAVEFTVADCKADRYHYECSGLGDCGGTYVLASEAKAEIEYQKSLVEQMDVINKSVNEKLTAERKSVDELSLANQEAAERERVLVDALRSLLPHVNETSSIGKVIMQALEVK